MTSVETRFPWKYLEVLGGILIVFGMLAVLPGCPYFALFPPIIYGRCDVSSLAGETGFVTAVAGTILFTSGEIGRRMSSPPKASIA